MQMTQRSLIKRKKNRISLSMLDRLTRMVNRMVLVENTYAVLYMKDNSKMERKMDGGG